MTYATFARFLLENTSIPSVICSTANVISPLLLLLAYLDSHISLNSLGSSGRLISSLTVEVNSPIGTDAFPPSAAARLKSTSQTGTPSPTRNKCPHVLSALGREILKPISIMLLVISHSLIPIMK